MFDKEIDTKGQDNPGEIRLNQNPKTDPAFAIEQVLLALSFRLTNANTTTAKVWTTEKDWDATKIKMLLRDNKAIINSISAKTLEALIQMVTGGFIFTPAKFVDVSVPASSYVDVNVNIVVPFRLAMLLAKPEDGDLCFDLIGDCSVTFPRPTETDLTMSSPLVSILASGHRDHNAHVKLGPTFEYNESTATATVDDLVAMGSGKLLTLALLSRDKSSYPVSRYAGLTLKIDAGLPIVDLPNTALIGLTDVNGDIYSQVPSDSQRDSVTHGAGLFRPHAKVKLSELPEGASALLHYATATDVVVGKYLYGNIIVREPPVSAALGVMPAFKRAYDKHGADGLAAAGIAHRPRADNAKTPLPAHVARFLPIHLRLEGIAS